MSTLWRHRNKRKHGETTPARHFDSCCGVGEYFSLVKLYPNAQIIGIDKSAMRTDKHERLFALPDNALMLRADVIDFASGGKNGCFTRPFPVISKPKSKICNVNVAGTQILLLLT